MRIALASLDAAWEDKPTSLERCAALARRAAALGAQLVVFPEMTLTGFTMNATSVAEPAQGSPTIAAFAELARETGLHVAFGVVLAGEPGGRPTNRLVVVTRDGHEAARYAKVHPFTFADEDRHYEGGEAAVSVRLDDVVFGLSVCYDLRFPELYTALAERCHALLVIANWPAARIAHWDTLVRARALDTQCYVIAVNRTGTDGNGLEYPYSSQVIGPRGEPLVPELEEAQLACYTITAETVSGVRAAFPMLRDRRPDVYARWRGGEERGAS